MPSQASETTIARAGCPIEAEWILSSHISGLRSSLQQGKYCSEAGTEFHRYLKMAITLLDAAQSVAAEQIESD